MFASLKNWMTRTLVVAIVPASLGLVLISATFAHVDSRPNPVDDGPGGSGYCLTTASDDVATDDGPGLGGGYGLSGAPSFIVLDGPGSNVPYDLD